MINPAHLDLFRAVLRHGGMTRAAARSFRPALPIETLLIRPAGRPPGPLAVRLVELLRGACASLAADPYD